MPSHRRAYANKHRRTDIHPGQPNATMRRKIENIHRECRERRERPEYAHHQKRSPKRVEPRTAGKRPNQRPDRQATGHVNRERPPRERIPRRTWQQRHQPKARHRADGATGGHPRQNRQQPLRALRQSRAPLRPTSGSYLRSSARPTTR